MPRGSNYVADESFGIVIKSFNAGSAAKKHFLPFEDPPMFDRASTEWCPIHGAVVKWILGIGCFCLVRSPSGLKRGDRCARCRVVGGGAGRESSGASDKRKNAEERFHDAPQFVAVSARLQADSFCG